MQAYHRDVLEHMAPPPPRVLRVPRPKFTRPLPGINQQKKTTNKRGRKGDRKSGSRRHRKVVDGNKDNILL